MTNYGLGAKRGPYGTNDGDTWLGVDSEVGRMLKERDGMTLIHEVIDGEPHMYVTDNPELIAEAEAGHELWVAAQALVN